MCIGRWLFPYWERCVAGQNSHAPDQNQSVLEGGSEGNSLEIAGSSTSRLLKRSDSGQVACCCRCPPPSPPPSFGAAVGRWVVVVPFPKSQFGGKDPIASRSGRTRVFSAGPRCELACFSRAYTPAFKGPASPHPHPCLSSSNSRSRRGREQPGVGLLRSRASGARVGALAAASPSFRHRRRTNNARK